MSPAAAFAAALLLWSSMEVVSAPLMAQADPFGLTFLRFLVGFAFLLVTAAIRGTLRRVAGLGLRSISALVLAGFLNTFLSMSLLQSAVALSTPATAAAVICTHPLMVLLASAVMGWEAFSLRRTGAFAACAAGVLLIGFQPSSSGGVAPALAAAACFAAYTMVAKSMAAGVDPLTANIVSFAGGLVSLGVFLAATGRRVLPAGLDAGGIARVAYLGILVSGAGYLAFFRALRSMRASAAAMLFFLKPPVATGFAVLAAGERPGAGFLAGLALIAAAGTVVLAESIQASRRRL